MRSKSLCLMLLWACILKSKGYDGVGYVVRSSVPIIKAMKLLSFLWVGVGEVFVSVSVYRSFISSCPSTCLNTLRRNCERIVSHLYRDILISCGPH